MATVAENGSKFFVTGIDTLRDPVRNTRWRVLIPDTIFKAVLDNSPKLEAFKATDTGTNLFALHVKDCKLPTIKSKTKEIWYMGFAQQHVVQQDGLHGEMDFSTILLEDFAAYEIMMAWHQTTINCGILTNPAGGGDIISGNGLSLGLGAEKDNNSALKDVLRNSNTKVELYNWMNSDVIYTLNLINAMPTSVGELTDLKYGPDADIMNFKFKLKYDRWTVTIPVVDNNNLA